MAGMGVKTLARQPVSHPGMKSFQTLSKMLSSRTGLVME